MQTGDQQLMPRCNCYYEVGDDTIRRDTNPLCDVHGMKRNGGVKNDS